VVFKSAIVSAHWDNWCYFHQGTHYLYYLITEHSGGEGFGVATSTDGVHWDDHGWAIRASDEMVEFLGTGAVWPAHDHTESGRFLCNYSEWRRMPGEEHQTQNILFAWSTDLIHWEKLGDETMFRVDPRHYDRWGRWDCIYPLPREGGGWWGTWTATSLPESPHPGTVGVGVSDDGLHWTALPAPVVTPGVGESGAFWRFGDRVHAMFGADMGMWSYVADEPTGPYTRSARNPRLLSPGHTYFSRFYPLPDGMVLVNHQSSSDWGWHIAPLKQAEVDCEGTLRLKWWEGNEALKGAEVAPGEAADFLRGLVLEGTLALPATVRVLPEERPAHVVHVSPGGRAAFGPEGAEATLEADRELARAAEAAVRLLVRRGMLELYVDDYLMECYHLAGSGGATRVRAEVEGGADWRAWEMTLAPGGDG
jgi:hypothetical protein